MKTTLNLTPNAIDAISELQERPELVDWITDTQDSLMSLCDDDKDKTYQIVEIMKGVGYLKSLLKKIAQNNE